MKKEWYGEFRETLKRREGKSAPKVRNLLRNSYKRVVEDYSHAITPERLADNFINNEGEWKEVYRRIYKDVYVGMGVWNTRKYMQKKGLFEDVVEYLTGQGLTRADTEFFIKRQLVFSSNRNAIIKVISAFRESPDFLLLNESAAKKFLLREFRELSKVQAAKIVRTEATNAANKALLDSTKRLFPTRTFRKEWVSARDGRTRTSHARANGQRVLMTGQFFVGGELLDHPGAGLKPENNIYCRCAVIPARDA